MSRWTAGWPCFAELFSQLQSAKGASTRSCRAGHLDLANLVEFNGHVGGNKPASFT